MKKIILTILVMVVVNNLLANPIKGPCEKYQLCKFITNQELVKIYSDIDSKYMIGVTLKESLIFQISAIIKGNRDKYDAIIRKLFKKYNRYQSFKYEVVNDNIYVITIDNRTITAMFIDEHQTIIVEYRDNILWKKYRNECKQQADKEINDLDL